MLGYQTVSIPVDGSETHAEILLESLSPDLTETIITGQNSQTLVRDAVQKVRVIDRATIDAMAANNVKDVLDNSLNFRVTQDPSLGSTLRLGGMGGRQIKILVNGVPVVGRQNGNVDLEQLQLANVQRIEVIEGPMSTEYGTDAVAGVINIITNDAGNDTLKDIPLNFTTYGESIGKLLTTARAGVSPGKSAISLTMTQLRFDGWSPNDSKLPNLKPRPADEKRSQLWKPRLQHTAELSLSRSLRSWNFSGLASALDDRIISRGSPLGEGIYFANDQTFHTKRLGGQLHLSSPAESKYAFNAIAAHNYFTRTTTSYLTNLITLEQTPDKDDPHQTSTINSSMSRAKISTRRDSALLNYSIGYDASYENMNGERIKGQPELAEVAAFSSFSFQPISRLTFQPGLRATWNSNYSVPLIPSLFIKFSTPLQDVRLSYAQGFRSPTLKEQYFYFVDINHNITGNPDLRPERSHNLQASYNRYGQWRNFFLNSEGSVFYNSIRNQISLAAVGDNTNGFTYANVAYVETSGIRGNLQLRAPRLTAGVGAAYIGINNHVELLVENARPTQWLYYPEVSAQVRYQLFNQTSISTFYKYNGPQNQYSIHEKEVVLLPTQDYHLVDLILSQKLFSHKLELQGGVKNLADVTQIASGGASGGAHSGNGNMIIGTGRTYFLSAGLHLR